jgi:DNA-binding response OmpR family regulator
MAKFLLFSERPTMPAPTLDRVSPSPTTVTHFPPNVTADTPYLPLLISDDDPHITRLYEAILSRLGLPTVSIPDGQAALDYIRLHPVSLIISDLNKPHVNGLDMLCQIRENPTSTHLPFIMITATPDLGTQRTFADLGGTLLLTKPFNMHTFTSSIMRLLQEQLVEESA